MPTALIRFESHSETMNLEEALLLDKSYVLGCLPHRDEIVIERAKGTRIFDSAGKEYVDLFAGIAVNNVGHCHPKVTAAIKEQVDRYMHVSNYYYNDILPELANKIAEVAPKGLSKTFFSNSGTEAIDGAVKLAKKYAYTKGRNGMVLISLQGSFHGRLSLALSLTGQKKIKEKLGHYACYPGILYAPAPYHYRYGNGLSQDEFGNACAEEMEDLVDNYAAGDVAAVVLEPILCEGGMIVPPDTYLPRVQRICKARNVLLVVDEVQTGIARSGKMFASELWNLEPDEMAFAKAIGGGLPIGGFMSTDEVASSFEQGDHFSTFGGNPVCCAAALAVLDVVEEEDLVERARSLGEYTMKELRIMAEKYELVGEVRGKGLLVGIELVKDKTSKKPAAKEAAKVREEMLRKGYLIGVGGLFRNVIRLEPPLIMTEDEIDGALDALSGVVSSLAP
jgi:4-aminobutyrate aminotransferase-like enzyme